MRICNARVCRSKTTNHSKPPDFYRFFMKVSFRYLAFVATRCDPLFYVFLACVADHSVDASRPRFHRFLGLQGSQNQYKSKLRLHCVSQVSFLIPLDHFGVAFDGLMSSPMGGPATKIQGFEGSKGCPLATPLLNGR